MRIEVIAKPKKKREFVEQVSPTYYVVSVKEPAEKGRANAAIISALAKYFDIPRTEIILISGQTSKLKILEVPDRLINFEVLPKQKELF